MLEIKDGMDFHDFMLALKPESWFKRREDETVTDCLNRISRRDSKWLEKAEWRERNSYWLDDAFKISFSIYSFMKENNIGKETFEELTSFEVDLSGSYDWTLSEIRKLELIMNIKLL